MNKECVFIENKEKRGKNAFLKKKKLLNIHRKNTINSERIFPEKELELLRKPIKYY